MGSAPLLSIARMFFAGRAHPPAPKDGRRLRAADLSDAEMRADNLGKRGPRCQTTPLHVEHEVHKAAVGEVLSSYQDSKGGLRVAGVVSDPAVARQVREGSLRGLSLSTHMQWHANPDGSADTSRPPLSRVVEECSLCAAPGRPTCWVDEIDMKPVPSSVHAYSASAAKRGAPPAAPRPPLPLRPYKAPARVPHVTMTDRAPEASPAPPAAEAAEAAPLAGAAGGAGAASLVPQSNAPGAPRTFADDLVSRESHDLLMRQFDDQNREMARLRVANELIANEKRDSISKLQPTIMEGLELVKGAVPDGFGDRDGKLQNWVDQLPNMKAEDFGQTTGVPLVGMVYAFSAKNKELQQKCEGMVAKEELLKRALEENEVLKDKNSKLTRHNDEQRELAQTRQSQIEQLNVAHERHVQSASRYDLQSEGRRLAATPAQVPQSLKDATDPMNTNLAAALDGAALAAKTLVQVEPAPGSNAAGKAPAMGEGEGVTPIEGLTAGLSTTVDNQSRRSHGPQATLFDAVLAHGKASTMIFPSMGSTHGLLGAHVDGAGSSEASDADLIKMLSK